MKQISGPRATWLLSVLLMGLFIVNVDVAVVNVATPSIHERLNASGSELQLVVSGYVLSYAMLLITGARLGGIYGYRRLFLIGLGIFTLASLACGLAPNVVLLIIARVIQGIGAALLVPQVLIGIQLNFSGAARARALGFYAVALSVGAAVIATAFAFLPKDSGGRNQRLDFWGVGTLSAAILLAVLQRSSAAISGECFWLRCSAWVDSGSGSDSRRISDA